MLAYRVHKDFNSFTGEVENIIFYSDKKEDEYIRLNFHAHEAPTISYCQTVDLEDDRRHIECNRSLKDWSDFCTILQVAKAGINFI